MYITDGKFPFQIQADVYFFLNPFYTKNLSKICIDFE